MNVLEILGLNIKLTSWKKSNYLPLYITNNFLIQNADVSGVKCLALTPKYELPTLDALKKQIQQITEIEPLPIFIKLDSISNFRKENLLQNNIPFILEDKLAYLPFMATFLTKERGFISETNNRLTTSAQLLLIWILYQNSNKFFISDAVDVLHFSNMTMTRAYRQLVATKIFFDQKKGRKIYLSTNYSRQELFKRMKSYFKNPVICTRYLMKSNLTKNMALSGESALSHYGFINPPRIPVYAIHKTKIKNLDFQDELFLSKEQAKIEIWDYDPLLFSSNNLYVDVLSLIISLLNEDDERINIETENLLTDLFNKKEVNS